MDSDVVLEQDRKVPEYCWNAGICKDICEAQTRVLPGTFSVDLLSDTEFLVYKLPKTGRGMSETELALFADFIGGSYLWTGNPADIFVTPRTIQQARRDKAKMREYRRRITVERLAAAQARLWDLDLAAHRQRELRENPVGHGRGMIRRADKYLAQQHRKEPPQASGLVSAPPVLPDKTAMPDDYLSAREPSEFEYDSEETDPGEIEDGLEEDDASVSSDSTYKSNRHDTDRTCRTNLLYLQVTPTNSQDTAPVFVVPTADRQAAIDGCHRSAGHQGRNRTLSLMKERFWWPGMSQALLKAVANCGRCIQYEAKGQLPPMQPIICTEPMELVHIDYVGMEVTIATDKKPVV